MFAGLFRRLGAAVHGHGHVGLRRAPARRSCRRPSWPLMCPRPGTAGMAASFILGRCLGDEIVHAGLGGDGGAVSGLSPVIMTVLMPIVRKSAEILMMPCLTMSSDGRRPEYDDHEQRAAECRLRAETCSKPSEAH